MEHTIENHIGFSHYIIATTCTIHFHVLALQLTVEGVEHELAVVFCEGEGITDCRGDGKSTHKHRATMHSEEARAMIGKYTLSNGIASARRYFKKQLGDFPIKYRSKVRTVVQKGAFCMC